MRSELLCTVALVTGVLVGRQGRDPEPIADVVRARSFELVAEDGSVRGTWRVDPSGGASLRLRSTSGRNFVDVYAADATPGDEDGQEVAMIYLEHQGAEEGCRTAGLAASDEGSSVSLAGEGAGTASIGVHEGTARVRVAPWKEAGKMGPSLEMRHDNGALEIVELAPGAEPKRYKPQ